jgi:tetratricopeptide (TPR) repeat protein
MTCDDVDQGELAERYARGRLSEEQQAGFEQHYFECARCFDLLQTSLSVQSALREETGVAYWRWGAVAAGIAACAVAAVLLRPSAAVQPPPPAQQTTTAPAIPESLTTLARFDPPPYVSLRVRGDEDRFESAMERYVRGDYAAAAERLRALATRRPASPNVLFYLGVSELMIGRPAAAISALQSAVNNGGREQAEHAQFLLAKAWLAQSRPAEARAALEACANLQGAHAREAGELLKKIP